MNSSPVLQYSKILITRHSDHTRIRCQSQLRNKFLQAFILPNEVTAAIAECLTALLDDARGAPTSRIPVNVSDYSRMPFNEQKVFGRRALTDDDGTVRFFYGHSQYLATD